MRIWSLHPSYLDSKGLVALWRETLLAKHVLLGKTKGYRNHPQLSRFKDSPAPVDAINYYLTFIYREAECRGYKFDQTKVDWNCKKVKLQVTDGQLRYEARHLINKLKVRSEEKFKEVKRIKGPDAHPMFQVTPGAVETWEVIS